LPSLKPYSTTKSRSSIERTTASKNTLNLLAPEFF
jgi:hypothetical protein